MLQNSFHKVEFGSILDDYALFIYFLSIDIWQIGY